MQGLKQQSCQENSYFKFILVLCKLKEHIVKFKNNQVSKTPTMLNIWKHYFKIVRSMFSSNSGIPKISILIQNVTIWMIVSYRKSKCVIVCDYQSTIDELTCFFAFSFFFILFFKFRYMLLINFPFVVFFFCVIHIHDTSLAML